MGKPVCNFRKSWELFSIEVDGHMLPASSISNIEKERCCDGNVNVKAVEISTFIRDDNPTFGELFGDRMKCNYKESIKDPGTLEIAKNALHNVTVIHWNDSSDQKFRLREYSLMNCKVLSYKLHNHDVNGPDILMETVVLKPDDFKINCNKLK